MLDAPLHMVEGFLDVVVDSVDESALLDDELIEVLVDAGELVDRFDEVGDLLVSLLVLSHLGLADLHVLEVVLHALPVFLLELDGQVGSS